jgi:hypothetical protein
MNPDVELWNGLTRLVSGDSDAPLPWLACLAWVLCRQRARQDWLVEVYDTFLDNDDNDDDDDDGSVPELPGWSYTFHGRGLCLTGPNREVLDVDFYAGDDGPQTIDPHFFITRVLHLERRPPPEARLVDWFGDGRELLLAGLDELRRRGVLVHPTSRHVFHLHPWLEARYAAIGAVQPPSAPPARQAFNRWAMGLLQDRAKACAIEEVAVLLPHDTAAAECRRLFAGPVDSITGRAVRTLRRLGAQPGATAHALVERLDPTQHNPFTAVELAEWYFQDGQHEAALALIQAFAAQRKVRGFAGNPFDASYAILALRFTPSAAGPLVRQALRSRTPSSLEQMAALLSVLDEPWCRQELLEAADDAQDPSTLRFILGCLLHSADEATRTAAQRRIPPPPEFSEATIGYTREEVAFLNLRQFTDHRRARAAVVAALLRPT